MIICSSPNKKFVNRKGKERQQTPFSAESCLLTFQHVRKAGETESIYYFVFMQVDYFYTCIGDVPLGTGESRHTELDGPVFHVDTRIQGCENDSVGKLRQMQENISPSKLELPFGIHGHQML